MLTVVQQLLTERKPTNAIYLNIGDNFQGTLWYEMFGWNVTSTFLNLLVADATVIHFHSLLMLYLSKNFIDSWKPRV